MNCQPPIQLQQDDIAALCRKWGIRELSLFGSALRDDFSPESDMDFLVSYKPAARPNLAAWIAIKEEL
ncbi:nucleotidyltransferase domain-containing protein, partial [Candidatus Sumerlaeota bacterium]|nr:nucleotidyltransferase domain-containing protein [Candidatus Sumerlaeota bacterium]